MNTNSNLDKYFIKIDQFLGSNTLNFNIPIQMSDMLTSVDISTLFKYIEGFDYKSGLIKDGDNIHIQSIYFPQQDTKIES